MLNCAGPDDVDVYENLPFEWAVASKIFKTVKEAFATYCNQRKNLVHERFKFWEFAESEGQSFESYFKFNKLRIMAKSCKFAETDNMIRDKIIFPMRNLTSKERLLREPRLTLDKTITLFGC